MEATDPGKSSYVIRRCDVDELVKAIIMFYEDREMRLSFGKEGRRFVKKLYEINYCFSKIEKLFEEYR